MSPSSEPSAGEADSPAHPGHRAEPGASLQVIPLPSGATVSLRSDLEGDDILVRSAGGAMEIRVRLTEEGPVLSLRGVRLEIEAQDSVAVKCREFAIHASEGLRVSAGNVEVQSDSEIRMRSGAQTFIDGDYVNLNCQDRTGYHDHRPDSKDNPAAEVPTPSS